MKKNPKQNGLQVVEFCGLLNQALSWAGKMYSRPRNMELESYTCGLCVPQKLEKNAHLFLRCNFARACWASIGASVIITRPLLSIFKMIKEIKRNYKCHSSWKLSYSCHGASGQPGTIGFSTTSIPQWTVARENSYLNFLCSQTEQSRT